MGKKKIILDTNFLLIPGQFKVDIFSEIERIADFPYELCVVQGTREELEKIAFDAKNRDKLAAKLGLAFLKQKNLKTLRSFSSKSVDDLIVKKAGEDTVVATQDSELRKRLEGVKIIGLRSKKHLVFVN